MSSGTNRSRTAVGFRVKSGWATAVLLRGPARSVRVLDRRVILLSDPKVAASRQPYHAIMRASPRARRQLERRLVAIVAGAARRSIRELLTHYRSAGFKPRRAGLVVGSAIDPAKIGNDHIRAHALEGRLFRTALAEALGSIGLTSLVLVERSAYVQAAAILRRPEAELRQTATELGRSVDGPWRADEKTAAVAAWVNLR